MADASNSMCAMDLCAIARELTRELKSLRFPAPVTHVYNPLEYARASHEAYLRRFGVATGRVVLLGMNPGPWGMAQTGVPFGEVGLVRDWLAIREPIGRPANEHPKRPVLGLDCPRSEVSGARLWGWARDRYKTPARFFNRFFVANYCPFVFMEAGGRNRTPDKLPATERERLLSVCDRALLQSVHALKPTWVIGVGAFAESCAKRALGDMDVRVGRILHPSPASPAANDDWAGKITTQLDALGLLGR